MKEHKKRFRIEFTVDVRNEGFGREDWDWSNEHIKSFALQELTCMSPSPEDITFSEVEDDWHTGTPTEEGLYLTAIKVDDGNGKYCYAYEPVWWKDDWCFRHFKNPIIAWMPIPLFED